MRRWWRRDELNMYRTQETAVHVPSETKSQHLIYFNLHTQDNSFKKHSYFNPTLIFCCQNQIKFQQFHKLKVDAWHKSSSMTLCHCYSNIHISCFGSHHQTTCSVVSVWGVVGLFLFNSMVKNFSRPLLLFTEEWLCNIRLSHTTLLQSDRWDFTLQPLPGNQACTGTPTHWGLYSALTLSSSHLVSCENLPSFKKHSQSSQMSSLIYFLVLDRFPLVCLFVLPISIFLILFLLIPPSYVFPLMFLHFPFSVLLTSLSPPVWHQLKRLMYSSLFFSALGGIFFCFFPLNNHIDGLFWTNKLFNSTHHT